MQYNRERKDKIAMQGKERVISIKLCYSAQMREVDRCAIEDYGIPSAVLMTNAAEHIAAAAMEYLLLGGAVAVFCGTGNNGGDGIGAAAILAEKGLTTRTFLIGDKQKLASDSKKMLERYNAAGGKLESFAGTDDIMEYTRQCDVIIDAIFGIGLINAQLQGDALDAVETINASGAFTIAADIPSGVVADTGAILGSAVDADMTVTFSLAKPGHFVEPGCTRRGKLRLCDIGIPASIVETVAADIVTVGPDDIFLPRRRADSHKGDYGRCFIVAGSLGFTGAPALCARAASRMGAGLVFLGVPEGIYSILAAKIDEEMPFPLPSDKDGLLAQSSFGEILRKAEECDVLLMGPGLGRSPGITSVVSNVILRTEKQLVLDADALNAIAESPLILRKAAQPVILTPHPGEFSRLGGSLSDGDRLGAARKFAQEYNCVMVLKGHRTISAFPDGTAHINTTGGPAMAKGGSGDVLAGMIAALMCQGFPIKDAVVNAVCIHGLAGDKCAEKYGEYSSTASDLIAMLPKAIKSLE